MGLDRSGELFSPPLSDEKTLESKEGKNLAGLTLLTSQGKKFFGAGDQHYEIDEVLGEGSYGSVYRCHRKADDAAFAVKIIDPMRLGFVGGERAIRRAEDMAAKEVNVLRKLALHPGVISLEAAFYSSATSQVFIVTDFLPGGHLFSHVVQRTIPLQEGEVAHIVSQVADALCFCHSLGLVHRDLKLENILVASVNVTLVEQKTPCPDGEGMLTSWVTQEVYTVKICDFGFAKSLEGFTTRTPIGTTTYSAPEVDLDGAKKKRQAEDAKREERRELRRVDFANAPGFQRQLSGFQRQITAGSDFQRQATAGSDFQRQLSAASDAGAIYDPFKADAYALGVMTFVMLCLAFPARDSEGSHRNNKYWPSLSSAVRSLLDSLLNFDPMERFSLIQVCQHPWVAPSECDSPTRAKRKKSRDDMFKDADDSDWESSRSPEARWRKAADHPSLPGVLALQRALVHIQKERSMALWALTGAPGMGGSSSCWDQLQWHIELSDKRVHEATQLLDVNGSGDESLLTLRANLARGRQLSHSFLPCDTMSAVESTLEPFDRVFAAYSDACSAIVDKVAKQLERVKPGSAEGRRAARRYRLFSSAAEQLGRERAFMCGHRMANCCNAGLSRDALQRLSEIIGARKILLGTAIDKSFTVATSAGLLGGMVGDDEPQLLSKEDIGQLELLEEHVLASNLSEAVSTEELYRCLTSLAHEIHSRTAIRLVDDMRLPDFQLEGLDDFNLDEEPVRRLSFVSSSCGCRAGLKRWLYKIVDRL